MIHEVKHGEVQQNETQFNCMQTKIKYKSMAARSMKLATFPLRLLKVFGFEVLKVIKEHRI
jgi:hypothetical protein